MLRLIMILLTTASLGYGAWWWFQRTPTLQNFVEEYIHFGDCYTLETRYTAKAIMDANKTTLLKNESYSFLDPVLQLYPYLLLQIKFSTERDVTEEGSLLWGLHDGELVIDTADWRRSKGYQDCIQRRASREDFKVLFALEKKGGVADRKSLLDLLHIDEDLLDKWIASCKEKQFVIQTGNHYRLHFASPRLQVYPKTNLSHQIVRKSEEKDVPRIPKKYNIDQIKETARAAFGENFAIRSLQEVFLPVYQITVQNPDGSHSVTYWNALNGKMMTELHFV